MTNPVSPDPLCPLCNARDLIVYHSDKWRQYLQCKTCSLVFVPCEFWLNLDQEKSIYDLHENEVHDPGYQKFLSRLANPLIKRLSPNSRGLDFGCGQGPALQWILQQSNHDVSLYDFHYFPDRKVLDSKYDFVCATEVVEHLHSPRETFLLIKRCLKDDGIFAVMTQMVINAKRFANWRYIQDPTHICFFNLKSLSYVAELMDKKLEQVDRDVIFIH